MSKIDGSTLAGREREEYVTGMFNRIARPYDRLNQLISLGRCDDWRREALDWVGVRPQDVILDLGCGTGDFLLESRRRLEASGQITGIDVAEKMLAIAGEKAEQQDASQPAAAVLAPYELRLGSAAETGLPDASVDLVTMGWVLRNVGDRQKAYAEILRILKPGGSYLSLDMSQPAFAPLRWASSLYLALAMPVLIRMAGGDREAYRYLDKSTRRFPRRKGLEQEWQDAGFVEVASRPFMLGTIAAVRGRKPLS